MFAIGIGLVGIGSVSAQDNKKASIASGLYVISAKAGAVNYSSGEVFIVDAAQKRQSLKKGDSIEVGERVVTGTNGKVEILLNPGSFVRLSGDSEFEFLTTSLDNLQVRVLRGSAMFEVIAERDFKVTVATRASRFYLINSGVYRVDTLSSGGGRLSVWKGKAQVVDAKATVVKGGRSATFENMTTDVAKFDRDVKGELEDWSKTRAKEIAKLNAGLQQRQMRGSLINTYGQNSWQANRGFGLWVLDPISSSYCFLPFGYGWSSPYGFGYSRSIWSYQLPEVITAPLYQNNPTVSGPNITNNLPNSSGPMNPSSNTMQPGIVSRPISGGPQGDGQSVPMMERQQRPNIVDRKQDQDQR